MVINPRIKYTNKNLAEVSKYFRFIRLLNISQKKHRNLKITMLLTSNNLKTRNEPFWIFLKL